MPFKHEETKDSTVVETSGRARNSVDSKEVVEEVRPTEEVKPVIEEIN